MAAKKAKHPLNVQVDEAQIEHFLQQRQEMAAELRQSTSRAQANTALAAVYEADEATQFGLVKALAKLRETDAADVLLALHELAPQKEVRKEARRALIQLAGSKIYPSWTPGSEQPTAIAASNPPRFWKGVATLMREQGEVELTLCWEQGFEYGEARMMSFLLDFWKDGVKDFYTEVGTKRHIDGHVKEQIDTFATRTTGHVRSVECTLAEGRRLVLEALEVNAWRKTQPHKDYRHYLPTVQQLLLNAAPADEDRGTTFINPDQEPDEVVGNFIGGWSLGDYGLCYDLLTGDSPLLEGLARDEWVARRRAWADEAHPQHFEPRVLREIQQQEQQKSGIWLPGAFLSERASTRREADACWSLELTETPLSGTLPEMPLGTAVLRETGRHWFWTRSTLVQVDGAWRIQRIADEGANAQGLPLAELEKQIQEHAEAIDTILKEQDPRSPDSQRYYEEIIWRSIYSLHLLDALMVKNPLDYDAYADAVGRATSLGLRERALVYLEKWSERFPQHPQHLNIMQQIGAIQTLLAADYENADLSERAERFFELAEKTLQEAQKERASTMTYLLLAELHVTQGEFAEAETYLHEALENDPTPDELAQIENDLAGISIERDQYAEALRHFQRVAEISPNFPSIWYNIGHTHNLLKNTAEAEIYLRRAIDEEPENLNAFSELASLYITRHDFEQAREITERSLRLHPNSAHMHAVLAGIFMEKGDGRRAQEALEDAERIDPELQIVKTMRRIFNEARRR